MANAFCVKPLLLMHSASSFFVMLVHYIMLVHSSQFCSKIIFDVISIIYGNLYFSPFLRRHLFRLKNLTFHERSDLNYGRGGG